MKNFLWYFLFHDYQWYHLLFIFFSFFSFHFLQVLDKQVILVVMKEYWIYAALKHTPKNRIIACNWRGFIKLPRINRKEWDYKLAYIDILIGWTTSNVLQQVVLFVHVKFLKRINKKLTQITLIILLLYFSPFILIYQEETVTYSQINVLFEDFFPLNIFKLPSKFQENCYFRMANIYSWKIFRYLIFSDYT